MKSLQKGSIMGPMLILIALCIIIFVFIVPAAKIGTAPSIFTFGNKGSLGPTGNISADGNTSVFRRTISLGNGDASSERSANREYIEVINSGNTEVDITGWVLRNAPHARVDSKGRAIGSYASELVVIPRTLNAQGNMLTDVILKPGETAIITSGSPISHDISSAGFKENMCSNLIDPDEEEFEPSISGRCLDIEDESGFSNLDRDCRESISFLSSCSTPRFGGDDDEGEDCRNCVNGERVSKSCSDFVRNRLSYKGCVASHASDVDFEGDTWRVFLNRRVELWGEEDDTVSLFDTTGNLVDSLEL